MTSKSTFFFPNFIKFDQKSHISLGAIWADYTKPKWIQNQLFFKTFTKSDPKFNDLAWCHLSLLYKAKITSKLMNGWWWAAFFDAKTTHLPHGLRRLIQFQNPLNLPQSLNITSITHFKCLHFCGPLNWFIHLQSAVS